MGSMCVFSFPYEYPLLFPNFPPYYGHLPRFKSVITAFGEGMLRIVQTARGHESPDAENAAMLVT
jgi:hypothetical protein